MPQEIGLIGYGNFGKFIAPHLAKFTNVLVYDPRIDLNQISTEQNIEYTSLDKALNQQIIILAIPVQFLEQFLKENQAKFNPSAIVIDVSSVKMIPVELMQKYLPDSCEILATHPLFGPISGKNGLSGLKVVTWPVRIPKSNYSTILNFLQNKLKLEVLEKSPEEHDEQMAYVQGLSFLLGEAFNKFDIPDTPLNTKTYEHLLEVKHIISKESPELIETIKKFNPKLTQVWQSFLSVL